MLDFVSHLVFLRPFLKGRNDATTAAPDLDVIKSPSRLAGRTARRKRREVLRSLVVPSSGILNQRVGVAIFLHAFRTVVQLSVHESAGFAQNILVTGQLVEALFIVAIAVQFNVLIVLIFPSFRFDHL